jgi:predicted O-methyltransferase YrrM
MPFIDNNKDIVVKILGVILNRLNSGAIISTNIKI